MIWRFLPGPLELTPSHYKRISAVSIQRGGFPLRTIPHCEMQLLPQTNFSEGYLWDWSHLMARSHQRNQKNEATSDACGFGYRKLIRQSACQIDSLVLRIAMRVAVRANSAASLAESSQASCASSHAEVRSRSDFETNPRSERLDPCVE